MFKQKDYWHYIKGTHGTCSWGIDFDNVLTIYPTNGTSGELENQKKFEGSAPWSKYGLIISKVVVEQGVLGNTSVAYLFHGLRHCTEMDLRGLDTSKVEDMTGMFDRCHSLVELDLNGFKMGSVTDVSYMFSNCWALKNLYFRNLDLTNVANEKYAFFGCDKLKNRKELEYYFTNSAWGDKTGKMWEPPKQNGSVTDKNHDEPNR